MAEKNSFWKNIRNKAKQNKRTGTPPKEPTDEMLYQEKKIKASYANGGFLDKDKDKDKSTTARESTNVSNIRPVEDKMASAKADYDRKLQKDKENKALDQERINLRKFLDGSTGSLQNWKDRENAMERLAQIDNQLGTKSLEKEFKILNKAGRIMLKAGKYVSPPMAKPIFNVLDTGLNVYDYAKEPSMQNAASLQLDMMSPYEVTTRSGTKFKPFGPIGDIYDTYNILNEKAYGGYIYADGGPLKKDLYDTPIESKIVSDPTSDRSFYDPRLDQINLGSDYDQMDDYSRDRLLAHENFHGKQFKKGYSTLLPTRTTYKEPSMASNDETYYTYHNRQKTEIKKLTDNFKKENNSFNFVPDDIVFNKVTDTAQYYDPTTLEGEAKFYEDLGADISEENKNNTEYKYGGTMKKRFKKRLAIGGMLPDQDASNAQALGQFAQLQAIQNTGQGMVQNWGDNYLSDRGFDQGEIDIVNKKGGRDLAKIPGVGMWASMGVGAFNAVTGRTKDALADYRLNKQKGETQRANDFNDYSGYAQDAQVTFAQGGDISMLEGPSHAEGGIQLTNNAEVEGGEVKADDFILSDRLGDKNGTFAEQMKKEIKKGSPLRDSQNDTYSKFRIMNKKNKLVAMNKAALSDMENIMMAEASGESPQAMMAMGGYLKRKKMYSGGNMLGPGKKKLINPLDYPNLFTPYESPVIPDDLKKEDAEMLNLFDGAYSWSPVEAERNSNIEGWNKPLTKDRADLLQEWGFETPVTNNTGNDIQATPEISPVSTASIGEFSDQFSNDDIIYNNYLDGKKPKSGPLADNQLTEDDKAALDFQNKYSQPGQMTADLINNQSSQQGVVDVLSNAPKKLFEPNTTDVTPTVYPNDTKFKTDSEENLNNKFGMDAMDYGSIAAGAAGGLSQLYYGLKGPDEVRDAKLNLARASKINLTRAKRLASQEIDSSFNLLDRDLAQTASSAGNYAGNRLASAIKRARTKSENNARLSESEETQNVGIQNQLNQYNSQVLNQQEQLNLGQEDKRVQEKDSARMAVTEGLNNIGQSVGQGNRDRRAYAWQDELANNWMGTDNFVTDSEGNRFFVNKDGKLVRKNKKTNTKQA